MTSLRLVRRIKARPQVVFDAVTTAEGIARWWGPDAGPVLVAEAERQYFRNRSSRTSSPGSLRRPSLGRTEGPDAPAAT